MESDEQWQAVQQHRGGVGIGQHRPHAHRGGGEQQQQLLLHQQETGSQVGGHVSRRASGYVNSGAETETEMVASSSMRRNRRRQR